MARGIVFDIRKYSIHDGPGIRTTVFLKGCPLKCAWCHNPEGQSARPELVFRPGRCIGCRECVKACGTGAVKWDKAGPVTDREKCMACGDCAPVCHAGAREIAGREMEASEAAAEAERDRAFYEESGGGVTISGGEPLAQPAFTLALLEALRRAGLHTALDTCGMAGPGVFRQAMPLVDLFLYDLKAMDPLLHRRFTGVGNEEILGNLRALVDGGAAVLVRIPVVPGVNDGAAEVGAMAAFAAGLKGLKGVDLLAYHRGGLDKYSRMGMEYGLPGVSPPSRERMGDIARVFRQAGLKVGGTVG